MRTEIYRREAAAQFVVKEPDEFHTERDFGAATTGICNQRDEAVGRDGRETEDGDVGEGNRVGHANRVRVGRGRRIGVRTRLDWFECPAVGLDHPFDLLGVRNVEVGKLHRRVVHQMPIRSGPTNQGRWHVGGGGWPWQQTLPRCVRSPPPLAKQ